MNSNLSVSVHRSYFPACIKQIPYIEKVYEVKLSEINKKDNEINLPYVNFAIEWLDNALNDSVKLDIVNRIQKDLEKVNICEDSSYDSESEDGEDFSISGHRSASRTPSDTLAAEFSEYVNLSTTDPLNIEFAVKLGYSENQAHAALRKLGSNTTQNELLQELLKTSAQQEEEALPHYGQTTFKNEPYLLRPVVIDGSNVAMSHGNKEIFSCRGIEICVNYFRERGHQEITVFIPKWRKETSHPDNPIIDRNVLDRLEKTRVLVFTPSRLVGGKRLVCYDDRYILKLAVATEGIVVSNDNYRDLAKENPEFRHIVETRLLMFSFVNDRFMPPDDPLGRKGPNLDVFLRMPTPSHSSISMCPYGRKCTYGYKCKYYHPERVGQQHRTIAEKLSEKAKLIKSSKLHTLSLPPSVGSSYDFPRTKSFVTLANANTSNENITSENPHKKLARQLTLKSQADPRLPLLYSAPPSRHATAMRVSSAPGGSVRDQCTETSSASFQESRRLMRARLLGIFPENQVDESMRKYPYETDARLMCAIILEKYKGR